MYLQSSCSLKLAPQRGATKMLFSFICFFAPFSIFYIPHNYVLPQAMPHAIPQTHSSFYPHRCRSYGEFWQLARQSVSQSVSQSRAKVSTGFTIVSGLAVAAFDLVYYSLSVLQFVFVLDIIRSRHKASKSGDRFVCNTYIVRIQSTGDSFRGFSDVRYGRCRNGQSWRWSGCWNQCFCKCSV